MRATVSHTRVLPFDDQQNCWPQVLDDEKPSPNADIAESVQGVSMQPGLPVVPLEAASFQGVSMQPGVPVVPLEPSKPTRIKPARGPPSKRKPLLLRLRRLRDGCSKLCFSPIGAILAICSFSLLYCILEILLPPPFGINAGANSTDCSPSGFEPMPICICPRETVCVKGVLSLVFLVLARSSAYFDYPLYVLLFLSKAHNLRGALQRTYISEFLPLDDLHHIHTFAGRVVGFEVISHSFWHLLRWGLAGEIHLLWTHVTGVTGLISLLATPLIVWPMLFTTLRKKIPFEWRKAAHYLSIVWGVAICFHAPQRYIGYIMGSAVSVYALDWMYGWCFQIHRAETMRFTRIGTAVEVVWEHPKGFRSDGAGYVYICLPWISKTEWHAFSLVKHPTLPNHSCVCMAAVGDWTKKVHAALAKPCARPAWIYGPFPSPFSTASGYDNLIAIASGIGITPSISTVVHLGETRQVHLIWMCRDAELVEFYMKTVQFDPDSWTFIYYTGKRELVLGARPDNPRLKVITGRPDLEALILGIIDNAESDIPMCPKLMQRAQASERSIYEKSTEQHFRDALERALVTYSYDEIFHLAINASAPVNGGPPPLVDLAGFIRMVRSVCKVEGEFGLTDVVLARHFNSADTNGRGGLNPDEVKKTIENLRKEVLSFTTSETSSTPSSPPSRRRPGERVRRKSKEKFDMGHSLKDISDKEHREWILSGWQMMYCGGAKPVVDTLRAINDKYNVPLKVESYGW